MPWVRVAGEAEVPEGGRKVVLVDDVPIAVLRVEGTLYAVRNVCPHRGGPVAEGRREGTRITCPLHDWTFDLRTGAHVDNPAVRVATYPVRVEGGAVEVDVPGAAPAPPAPERRGFWRFGR